MDVLGFVGGGGGGQGAVLGSIRVGSGGSKLLCPLKNNLYRVSN